MNLVFQTWFVSYYPDIPGFDSTVNEFDLRCKAKGNEKATTSVTV